MRKTGFTTDMPWQPDWLHPAGTAGLPIEQQKQQQEATRGRRRRQQAAEAAAAAAAMHRLKDYLPLPSQGFQTPIPKLRFKCRPFFRVRMGASFPFKRLSKLLVETFWRLSAWHGCAGKCCMEAKAPRCQAGQLRFGKFEVR